MTQAIYTPRPTTTYSTNAGVSFSRNIRLTTRGSQSLVGVRYQIPSAAGQVELGSRLGLLSTNSTALAAWPDTSNTDELGDSTGGPIHQDVVATEVNMPGSTGGGVPWYLPVMIGVAAVLVVGLVAWGMGRMRRAKPVLAARHQQVGAVVIVVGAAVGVPLGLALSQGPATPVTPIPTTVTTVSMQDYRFVFVLPGRAGRVVFLAHNDSRRPHSLSLIELPVSFPLTIQQQVSGTVRRAFPTLGYLPDVAPGQGDAFSVDLGPGRYAVLSYTRDSGEVSDAKKGMETEFRIR